MHEIITLAAANLKTFVPLPNIPKGRANEEVAFPDPDPDTDKDPDTALLIPTPTDGSDQDVEWPEGRGAQTERENTVMACM